ncbi:MAG: 1-phosphofructokinase [Bacillota bacterium]
MSLPSVITAVALNPAIDRTLRVPGFAAGSTNRVTEARLDPGGKGVNVARVLKALRAPVEVVGFLGEANGRLITAHLEQLGVPNRFITVEGQNRVNLKLVDPITGELTEVNDLGFTVQPLHVEWMTALVRQALSRTRLLVLAGSLPPGIPATYYRELVELARQARVPVILDADGEPMRAALGARPTLIKPNQDEAERLLGRSLSTRREICAGARALLALGPEMAVISCGAEGAVIAAPGGTWWANPPTIEPGSTVGAGDSMVAALALALSRGLAPVDALRLATAAGAATASLPGTQLASQADVDRLLAGVTTEEV